MEKSGLRRNEFMIVARYLKTTVRTSFDFPDKEVPPIGYIDGIDLTTEGVITLRRLLQLSERYLSIHDLTPKTFTKTDGASLLATVLLKRLRILSFSSVKVSMWLTRDCL